MTFICKAPWVSIAFQPTGVAPCCIYELDHIEKFDHDFDKLFVTAKESFLKGEVPPGCKKCHRGFLENKKTGKDSFDRYQTDFKTTTLREINVKANNLCNLACRSCGPHFSSKWEEEFNRHIVITKDSELYSKLDSIDFSSLEHITFAGGEPTMTKEHVTILQKLINDGNTNVNIRIATNLHVTNFKGINLIELWKKFPNLTLQGSIDAVEDNAVNIRSGSNWAVMSANLSQVIENNINYTIHPTISALNIWFIEDTLKKLKDKFGINSQRFSFNILSEPDILHIGVIPNEYRTGINDMLDRCISDGYQLSGVKDYLNKSHHTELWNHFLLYNLMLDATRKENFFNSLPIKTELINQWVKL